MSLELVIDASVVVKVFVQEELSQEADALLQRLDEQPHSWFFVPPHFISECTTSSGSTSRRFNYPPDAARRDLASLRGSAVPDARGSPLLVLELAIEFDITTYDAGYTAPTASGHPFVTADERLVRKLKKATAR